MSEIDDLQTFVRSRLIGSSAAEFIADRVLDNPKPGTQYPYVSFGVTDADDDPMDGVSGETITMTLNIWSDAGGRTEAAQIASRVRGALDLATGVQSQTGIALLAYRAQRYLPDPGENVVRCIMTFEANVERG